LSKSKETEFSVTKEIQVSATQKTPAQEIQVPTIQKIQSSRIPRSSKLKSHIKTYPYPSVTTPFKPSCHSDSPMIASYGRC